MKREKTSSRKGGRPGKKTERKKRPPNTKEKISQDCWGRKGDFPIVSVMAITQDITEQKRMESSLKSERDRLVNILNSMTDGVYIVNQHYGIEYANPAMQREFGPFEGRKCHEYLVGTEEPCSWCKWSEIQVGNTTRIEWMCPRNGKIYDSIDTPLQNSDGTVSKLKIIRDVTERKRMEQALRESQNDLNRAQAVAHTGSWRLDVRRNELLWSDETHRIFGIPRGTPMTYETFLATVHSEDREYVDQQWLAALRGEPYDIEHRIVVDGAVKWVRERAELEFDKEGVLLGGFGTAQDITELRKVEEALRHSRDTLEIRVKERTAELLQANKRLKEENEERLRTEQSLKLEEARLDALLRLSQFSETSVAEIAAFVLEQGIALTQSKIGFVGFLNEDESVFTLHGVSKNVVKECNVIGDPVQLHTAGAGLWGDVIRERKTLFINDYSKPHPRKKGIPSGHPPVERFMVVPVFEGKRIVAVAGVGNKTSDYDQSDERQILLLLGGIWSHIQRERSREELQRAHDALEQKVEQRTAELAASNAALQNEITERKQAEEALREKTHALSERVKELNCLYDISHLVEKYDVSLEEILQGTVDLIPFAWRYPEAACARIILGDREFRTKNFQETRWKQKSDIITHGHQIGSAEVYYLSKKPESDEGPFRKEERRLIEAVGERLGRIIERKRAEKALRELKDQLEVRVQERTTELKGVVETLQEEMAERRQAEEELRRTKAVLEKTMASLVDVVFVANPASRTIIACNKAVETMFGYTEREVIGRNTEFLYKNREMYEEFGSRLFSALDAGDVYHTKYEMRRKDGSVFPTEITVTEMLDDSGERTGVVSLVRDISERVLAERMLRESEVRYRSLFEDSRDPVYVVTRDGTFVDFNRAMIDLFSYSREELMDKNIRDLYVNPDERPRFQRFIERRGSLRDYGVRFRRKNGRVRECMVTASLRRAEDGAILGYQGIIRDITRQRRYQGVLQNYAERLRALSQKLLDAQENERRLIARDLHDSIGGSLSAIKFSLGRKLDQMEGGGASREILLEDIISMVQKTIDENRRIMTELRPSLLDDLGVVETIDWFCGEFEGVYSNIRVEKQVEIEESEIPEHLKIVVFRILQEAMNNVAKHSGGDLVHIYFGKTDGSIEIAIEDNGQGLDARRLINQGEDRGMGLSSMRERAELFGGTFSIESKLEGGTTVRAKWEIKSN